MSRLRRQLPLWAAALWWGSLSVVGFLVVPMLFAYLPTPVMAGHMAARLFTAQTWLSVACAGLLLLLSRPREGEAGKALQAARLLILGGLILALLQEYAVSPRIVARENLALWHGVGSAMYLLQWVCAALTFWRLGAGKT